MEQHGPPVSQPFPIVGIGASAGGLAAFELFFSGVPVNRNPRMAFVVVQHLDPVHKSLLAELLRGFTSLRVLEVTDGTLVHPNRIYVIPPGQRMTISGRVLHLCDLNPSRNQPLPIDAFFVSLAKDQGSHAVAVVLSGTGSDGALGIQAVREAGGLVLAQESDSAQFDGMPASATATGVVDAVLPACEMVARILGRFQRKEVPVVEAPIREWDPVILGEIMGLLLAKTNHDFAKYKPTTVQRRIDRRMLALQKATLAEYRASLDDHPEEITALFDDLLIGVTGFFRDPAVFEVLATRALPAILDRSSPSTPFRVWSAGCSTGEEAYSLAMVLRELLDERGLAREVQVFATDIDKRAIESARLGVYPASIVADLGPERLARFFAPTKDGTGYKVNRAIRDMVVFSEHDLIKDPPFFRLDLLVCRNLLIYLSVELQKKVIPLFHYALNPWGTLVLGTSETVGDFGQHFEALDRTSKVYVRKETSAQALRVGPRFPSMAARRTPARDVQVPAGPPVPLASLKDITEQTILRVQDRSAALVNAEGEILYLHGKTGAFLEPAPGIPGTPNLLKMARDGLRYPLQTALHQVLSRGESVVLRDLRTAPPPVPPVTFLLHPVGPVAGLAGSPILVVVLMEEGQGPTATGAPLRSPTAVTAEDFEALRLELETKEAYLQNTTEEMESANEELRSTNEELQSVNEELQSTNEELETSKEELQSVNEELSTVNTELNSKVSELTTSNNDMNNLLAATGVATVFVDLQKKILRFTPEATRVIHLIPGDLGRPVGHLALNLVDDQGIDDDTQAVLDTLIPREREVRTRQGAWYRLRIQPYRTTDNVIEGAVISFIDITEIVSQRTALQKNNDLLRLVAVVQDAKDPIIVQDLDGKILAWNPRAVERYGWTEAEALTRNIRDHIPPELQDEAMEAVRRLSQLDRLEAYPTQRLTKAGTLIDISVTSTALVNQAGKMYAITTIERPRGTTME